MTEHDPASQFIQNIRQSFEVPEPRPEFVADVYSDLMHRTAVKTERQRTLFALRPAWFAAFSLLTLVIAGTLVIGPQRVYAGLQTLLGYVPGIGFVGTDNAFALREPVEQTDNGRTFQLEQFVCTREATFVVVRIVNFVEYQDVGLDRGLSLQLPDGRSFSSRNFSVDFTGTPGEYVGVFQFDPLPIGTRKAAITWKETGNQAGARPFSWQISADLYPISDAEVAKLLPTSYQPAAATATDRGVTLTVDQVSYTQVSTAIRVQMTFPMEFESVSLGSYLLMEDQGRTYPRNLTQVHFEDQGQSPQVSSPSEMSLKGFQTLHQTLSFSPVDTSAKRLTLQVDRLGFRAPVYQTFPVDLGDHPSIGDQWAVNQIADVGGISFRVAYARMVALDKDAHGAFGQPMVGLVLDIEPVNADEVQFDQVWLRVWGASEVSDEPSQTWVPAWPADHVPTGLVEIHLDTLQGSLSGNWKIEWDQEK